MDISQKHWAKIGTKDDNLYESIYVTFWNRQIYKDTYQIRSERRELIMEENKEIWGVMKIYHIYL